MDAREMGFPLCYFLYLPHEMATFAKCKIPLTPIALYIHDCSFVHSIFLVHPTHSRKNNLIACTNEI